MNTDRFSKYRNQDLDRRQAEVDERRERESEFGEHKLDLNKSSWPRICPSCGMSARHCCCLLKDIGAD